jgi:membrane protein implicated in regulation of membrane protease activity
MNSSGRGEPDDSPDRMQGRIGRVTVPIPTDGPGEIMVAIRGGTEHFAAWCDEPVPKHSTVVVVEVRSPRSVEVTPFPEADNL